MFKKLKEPIVAELTQYGIDAGFINHKHMCELMILYGTLNGICPNKCKRCSDICDDCIHMRIINLTADGLHITDIE